MAKPTSKLGKRDLTSRNCSSSSNSSSTDDTVSIRDHDRFRDNSTTLLKRKRRRGPRESPPQRSSVYRGVTRHRWTGRYEAHLWDKNCWNESQKKKGRQVYLGAYDDEAAAARAYDLAALKYWGTQTLLNFPLSTYESALTEMEGLSREEYIGSLRRKSNGFSRGVSKYRGVARHHHNGRWEARIGRVFGNKYLYLGTYATQEEAATAYDIAAIEYRGVNAVTNFDLNRYTKWLKPNNSEIQPNIFSHFGDAKSSDSTTSTLSFDNNLDLIHDQVEKAICIGESMWARSSLIDCSSTLLDDDGKLLHCDHPIGEAQTYMEGQGSSCNDVGNGDEDFFSDLSSFLCDFDKLEADHVSLQIPEN